MKKIHIHFAENLFLPFFISAFLLSCNSTKKLAEDELLLNKNIVINPSGKSDKKNISAYIKQKPNRKVLFWKMYLHIYNSVDREKLERIKTKKYAKRESHNVRKKEKYARINAKREAKGKEPLTVKLKSKEPFTLKEWWLSIGEAPVVYDSLLSKKSAKQIKQYLNNKGYFNSVVNDSAVVKDKKVTQYYVIRENLPYTIRNVSYEIKDEQLSYYVLADASQSFVKRGDIYDADVLHQERNRITDNLRNSGYYYFVKEYIYFEADSSLGSRQVDITLGIKNLITKSSGEKDSVMEIPHSRYYMNNIYIYTNYEPKIKSPPTDTLFINDYYLMSHGASPFKSYMITQAIFLSKGELFQQKHADLTYKRLSELKMFRSVQFQFVQTGSDKLDCYIYLSNIPKQAFSAETEGTNTSGTLGIAGNLIYQNRNTFKGGEIFEVKIKGAMEVQKSASNEAKNPISEDIEKVLPFNTLELGGDINLFVPRFLFPFHIKEYKSSNAKTTFTSTYNFQRRPDYGRSISNVSFGYSWKETPVKQHIINPLEFNLVNIWIDDTLLQNTIDQSTDLFLRNSYSDHLIFATRYTFIFNNQDIRKEKNFSYLRLSAEGAGNALRGIFNLIDPPLDSASFFSYEPKSEGISYTIQHIPFSQYLRFDADYRFYKTVSTQDKLVYRIAFGIGNPLYNLRALPLEKSFFSGGPNSLRAWQTRTLGPGAYTDSTQTNLADKIGDVKLEGNLEYRFHVIKILNAALFVDAGNIWLRKHYDSYPQGEFIFIPRDKSQESFIKQIAVGAGLGIRLDFNFFVLRLDGALKIRDPSYEPEKRLVIGQEKFSRLALLNFGIGYPF